MKNLIFVMLLSALTAIAVAPIFSSWIDLDSPATPFDIHAEPTLYTVAVLGDWIPDGGAQVFLVFPKCPLGAPVDTTWTGLAKPHIMAQGTVDSVYFEDLTTGLPIELVPVSPEMGMCMLRADGEGYFSIGASDNFGEMKSSVPVLFDIVPSGTTASKLLIEGPKLMNFDSPFSIHWVIAGDVSGRPVPSAFPGIVSSAVHVKIVGESIPDSSARVANAFDRVPLREVSPIGYYGIFPFIISDDQPEVVRVVAEAIAGTLTTSDTFEVTFLPDDEPANILVMGPGGLRVPEDEGIGLISLALVIDAPDFENYSTKVRLSAVDISGSASATIDPSGWQTMIGGAAGFTFEDSEADTEWVFIVPEADSIPLLEAPINTPLQVVPADWAIAFDIDAPTVSFTGETTKVVVKTVDKSGEIDSDYSGYFAISIYGDSDSSIAVIDSTTGDSWLSNVSENVAIPIIEGRRTLYLCDSGEDEIEISVSDAEEMGLFDMGLLAESPEYTMFFEDGASGGAVRYRFAELSEDVIAAGDTVIGTVTARTGSDEIDDTYTGSVAISASGEAVVDPIDGIISFERGIATFGVVDDSTEEVEIVASGPLFSDTAGVRFVQIGEGGMMAYSMDYDWIPMGAERNFRVVIFGEWFIETRYNGGASVSIFDPDSNGSIDAPDSIFFTSGLGYITVSNSDAEDFTISIYGDPEIGSTSFSIESRALVTATLPAVAEVSSAMDSILFDVTDTAFAAYSVSGTLDIWIEEQNDNSSLVYDSEVIISDGHGVVVMENSEPESIWVYVTIPEGRLFYMDAEEIDDWEYFVGGLEYELCDVGEAVKPVEFEVSRAFPNPFNPSFSIEIGNPTVADIDLVIFDICGKQVLHESYIAQPAGKSTYQIDACEISSGVYFLKVSRGDESRTVKAVLLK